MAIREYPLNAGFGFADYLLYVNGKACGVIEAKKEGSTLSGLRASPFAMSKACLPVEESASTSSARTAEEPRPAFGAGQTFLTRMEATPPLKEERLWPAQIIVIRNLKALLKANNVTNACSKHQKFVRRGARRGKVRYSRSTSDL